VDIAACVYIHKNNPFYERNDGRNEHATGPTWTGLFM
jgi:hypothetical protein